MDVLASGVGQSVRACLCGGFEPAGWKAALSAVIVPALQRVDPSFSIDHVVLELHDCMLGVYIAGAWLPEGTPHPCVFAFPLGDDAYGPGLPLSAP